MAPGETRIYRMTTERDLFRQEAIDARRGQWPGMISVAILLSRWILTLLGAGLATAIILFLVLGHCTERQQVNGQLAPTTGRLSVITASAGTVTHVFVHASARLPGMSNERDSAALGNTRAAIGAQLRAQRQR